MLGELPDLAHPSSGGLVYEGLFNEGGGSTIGDSSGNGHRGNLTNVLWVPGIHDPALSFNGVDSKLDAGDIPAIGDGTALSVAFWFYVPTGASTPVYTFFASRYNSGSNIYSVRIYWYRPFSTNLFRFQIRNSAASTLYCTVPNPFKPSPDAWHYCVCTYDNVTARIYIDGVDTGGSLSALAGPIQTGDAEATIGYAGNTAGGTDFLNGKISSLTISHNVLMPSEIPNRYRDSFARFVPDPIIVTSGGGGTEYQELLLAVTCAMASSKTDTEQAKDLLKAVSFASSVSETDSKGYSDLLKVVSFAASVSETDTEQAKDLLKAVSFAASVSGTDSKGYYDLLKAISFNTTASETDTEQAKDLLKAVSFAASVLGSDSKGYHDLLKSVTFAASVSETDIRVFLETGLAVSLVASVAKTDTSQMVDLLKAISFSTTASETDTSQMVDLNKPIAFTASVVGTDIRVFLETGLEVSFSAAVSKTGNQQMKDLLKAVSFSSVVSKTDISQMVDTELNVTMITVGDIGVEIYTPVGGVVNAIYGFVVIRQTTNN